MLRAQPHIRFSETTEDGPPFQLANDPPALPPWPGRPAEKTRQALLFTGLDCLPGQTDFLSESENDEGD